MAGYNLSKEKLQFIVNDILPPQPVKVRISFSRAQFSNWRNIYANNMDLLAKTFRTRDALNYSIDK